MSEYTNYDVSKRLAEMEFKEKPDMGVWGSKDGASHFFPVRESTDWSNLVYAYRLETLLNWLMHKPIFHFGRIQ